MNQEQAFFAGALRTPRAAAVSGILFSVLLAAALVLLNISIPTDVTRPGDWLTDHTKRTSVALALNLIPFAGIAFLWFIGVVRDRIGQQEDRLFGTVFLGSGLLFTATLFVAAAFFVHRLSPGAGPSRRRWPEASVRVSLRLARSSQQ